MTTQFVAQLRTRGRCKSRCVSFAFFSRADSTEDPPRAELRVGTPKRWRTKWSEVDFASECEAGDSAEGRGEPGTKGSGSVHQWLHRCVVVSSLSCWFARTDPFFLPPLLHLRFPLEQVAISPIHSSKSSSSVWVESAGTSSPFFTTVLLLTALRTQ
jgi:hypothetical protein